MTSLTSMISALYQWGSADTTDPSSSDVNKGEAESKVPEVGKFTLQALQSITEAMHRAACRKSYSSADGNSFTIEMTPESFRTMVLASLAIHNRMHAKSHKSPGLDASRCARTLRRALAELEKIDRRAPEEDAKAKTYPETNHRGSKALSSRASSVSISTQTTGVNNDAYNENVESKLGAKYSSSNGVKDFKKRNTNLDIEKQNEKPSDMRNPTVAGQKTQINAEDCEQQDNPPIKIIRERRNSAVVDPPLCQRMRVVFDPSRPLGMVFADTIVKHVRKGGQADLIGVQNGWRIAEVCGKPVIRGFKGSDRSVFHYITRDKTIPIGVVFECRDPEDWKVPMSKAEAELAKKGAGEVTLVFEANDVGLSMVTESGVVDKVTVGSEAHALGVQPGWVVKSIGGVEMPATLKSLSRDDWINQTLCKCVSSEEPVKMTFLLPHRLRPAILNEIATSPRIGGSAGSWTENRSSNGAGSTMNFKSTSSLKIKGGYTRRYSTVDGFKKAFSKSGSVSSSSKTSFSDKALTPMEEKEPMSSPRDFMERARMALSGFRKKKSGDEKATCIKQWEHTLALWMSSPREAIARARRSARREGIPAQIRAKAWFALVGNPVRVTPRLYDILLDSVKTEVDLLPQTPGTPSASWRASRDASEAKSHAYNNPIKTTDDCSRGGSAGGNLLSPPPRVRLRKQGSLDTEGSVCGDLEIPKLIRTDINRTFAHLSFFQRGCLLHDQLMELLCVYAKYRPDVGYIQGMSFVAGHLLLYFEDVYMAFVVLANLLNMPLFSTLFKPKASRHAFTEIYNLHRELLESHLPHLAHHFHEEGIEPDLYMLEWLITLFARRLRLDTLGRVWDMYLTHGEVFVHKVAIAIVKILEKALLSTGFAGCLKILKESPASIDPQTLIATCEGIRLRSSDLTQLTETHMKEGGRGHYISEA